jgi:Trk K+ transport system NAD-binding subunit
MDGDQDVVDIKVLNPDLDRVRIRELHLPLDVLVLSVGRGERTIISHGYTRIRFGDKVTVVGSAEKLAEVMLRLEG